MLIGDGLAVDVEGIFGMITKAAKESVRVCGDSGRGEGEERGDGGGLGFQGELGKKFAVDIDMEGRRVLNQISARLDRDLFSVCSDL